MPKKILLFIVVALVALPMAFVELEPRAESAPVPYTPPVVRTRFLPSENAFPIANRKPADDAVANGLRRLGIAGECGGLCFGTLDYFGQSRDVPRNRENVAPKTMSSLGLFLSRRHLDSIVANGARFVWWTLGPDRASWWFGPGVAERTRDAELARLAEELRRGRPVPLGLVRARSLSAVGRNHQVVAYALERCRDGRVRIRVYDPNHPLADNVSLLLDLDDLDAPIEGKRGKRLLKRWRGFFVERYSPAAVSLP